MSQDVSLNLTQEQWNAARNAARMAVVEKRWQDALSLIDGPGLSWFEKLIQRLRCYIGLNDLTNAKIVADQIIQTSVAQFNVMKQVGQVFPFTNVLLNFLIANDINIELRNSFIKPYKDFVVANESFEVDQNALKMFYLQCALWENLFDFYQYSASTPDNFQNLIDKLQPSYVSTLGPTAKFTIYTAAVLLQNMSHDKDNSTKLLVDNLVKDIVAVPITEPTDYGNVPGVVSYNDGLTGTSINTTTGV